MLDIILLRDISGPDAVLPHTMAETQFMTCPGWDAVLRHALFGTQFYNMSWAEHSFTICPVSLCLFNSIIIACII